MRRSPLLALAVALVAALLVTHASPAQADYDGFEWTETEVYASAESNFTGKDASLAPLPDGGHTIAWVSHVDDPAHPDRILSKTRPGGSPNWSAVQVVSDNPDGEGRDLELFATPDGTVVAVWLVLTETEFIARTSERGTDGVWSAPTELASGLLKLRGVYPNDTGATMVWTDNDDDRLYSRAWSDGAWHQVVGLPDESMLEYPQGNERFSIAARADGELTAVLTTATNVAVTRLVPGADEWTMPETIITEISACGPPVGILDQYGNIAAFVELCHQHQAQNYSGATYDPDGRLHIWWNSRSGNQQVTGIYPTHQVYCECVRGLTGVVVDDGDFDNAQPDTLVPGADHVSDRRAFKLVWDDNGDRTAFVGGFGTNRSEIRFFREGSNAANPDGSFLAPGNSTSGRTGYVSRVFPSGADLLVGYQHTAPAGNLGPGGSCNTRVLYADDTLSDFIHACFDGNVDHHGVAASPDGSVAQVRQVSHRVRFGTWAAGDIVPEPGAAVITPTWPALRYGQAATVPVSVRADGLPATGDLRLLVDGVEVSDATLSLGQATLHLPRTLQPGQRVLRVEYLGSAEVDPGSVQSARAVAKAQPGKPKITIPKKPTRQQSGKVKVTVAAPPAGLAKPRGTIKVRVKKGNAVVTRTKSLSGSPAGKVEVTIPKLGQGRWTVTATYQGDGRYQARSASAVKFRVG